MLTLFLGIVGCALACIACFVVSHGDERSYFIARRETIPLRDAMPSTTAPLWSCV